MRHTIDTYLKCKSLEIWSQSFYLLKKIYIEKSTSNENMENTSNENMENRLGMSGSVYSVWCKH